MPVVRLQNLPWSASAPDVRKFFKGLEIPNGGVRIIGGEEGECFVTFTSRRDAHDALRKDGDRLNDMRVKLFQSRQVPKKVQIMRNKNVGIACIRF